MAAGARDKTAEFLQTFANRPATGPLFRGTFWRNWALDRVFFHSVSSVPPGIPRPLRLLPTDPRSALFFRLSWGCPGWPGYPSQPLSPEPLSSPIPHNHPDPMHIRCQHRQGDCSRKAFQAFRPHTVQSLLLQVEEPEPLQILQQA